MPDKRFGCEAEVFTVPLMHVGSEQKHGRQSDHRPGHTSCCQGVQNVVKSYKVNVMHVKTIALRLDL